MAKTTNLKLEKPDQGEVNWGKALNDNFDIIDGITISVPAHTQDGANAGAKIVTAINALPSTGGTVDARGLEGSQNITVDMFSGVTKPVQLLLGSTTFSMNTTQTIDGATIHIIGQGPGATIFQWSGGGSSPMFKVQDAFQEVVIDGVKFLGISTPAKAAVELVETADGIPNALNIYRNIVIGDPFTGTIQFTDGFLTSGLNINNDRNLFENIRIAGCANAGMKISFTQNVLHYLVNVHISHCKYGIWNSGRVQGANIFFNSNTTADLYSPDLDDASAIVVSRFNLKDIGSELSARLALIEGNSNSKLDGGSFQITSSLNADGKIIKMEGDRSGSFTWEDARITQATAPSGSPHFSIKAITGSVHKHIEFRNLQGRSFLTGGSGGSGFDIATATGSDIRTFIMTENTGTATLPSNTVNLLGGAVGLNAVLGRTDVVNSFFVRRLSSPNTTFFEVQPSADIVSRNFADQALSVSFDSGATSSQSVFWRFRDRGVEKWRLQKNTSDEFLMFDNANGINRWHFVSTQSRYQHPVAGSTIWKAGGGGTILTLDDSGNLTITGDVNHDGTNAGFYGKAPVGQAASSANLTDSSGGTTDGIVAAVSGSGADTDINNNFAELSTKVNGLLAALRNLGLIGT